MDRGKGQMSVEKKFMPRVRERAVWGKEKNEENERESIR